MFNPCRNLGWNSDRKGPQLKVKAVVVAGFVMTLIGFAAPASAALLTFDTRAAFNAAAPGLSVEDFEEGNIGAGGIEGFDDPLDSSTNNVFFAPGDILAGLTLDASTEEGEDLFILGAGFALNPSIVVGANFFEASLNLLFSDAS